MIITKHSVRIPDNFRSRRIIIRMLLMMTVLPFIVMAQNDKASSNLELPDLLISEKGKQIKNSKDWEQLRRPELLNLFAENVYGKIPAPDKVKIEYGNASVNSNALNGKATRKQVTIYFGLDKKQSMDLLIYLPNQVKTPAPVFLGLNFNGNQAVHADTGITLSKRFFPYGKDPAYLNHFATEASRGTDSKNWPVEDIIEKGYGLVTIYYGDLQIDDKDSFPDGAGGLLVNPSETKDGDEPGAIAIWAWGLSRALDYLETDKTIDTRRVALIGHSRLGKTALWAGALDKRFAIVISNNSGEGGAAITRRKVGESIKAINTSFPHWFCSNYKKFNDRENDLPVDFHELVALIAPRPVYIASASEDQWADPVGEYLSGFYASAVYKLYGLKGLTSSTQPPVNTPVGDGNIGYHLRQGPHALTPYDWQQYLHFADRFFK